jgi:hypothetical protein
LWHYCGPLLHKFPYQHFFSCPREEVPSGFW